jgi:transcriptional regulator with XRE-family HTH domain
MKQAHAAELLGVSQTTISRWENGQQAPTPDEQSHIRRLMQARLDSASDRELARLVRTSGTDVHLICDLTHRLLALSPGRERCWTVPATDLVGTSLWRFASPEIVQAECHLPESGWYEPAPPALELETGANDSDVVRIRPSRLRWVRFQLSDGSFARLVETVAWKEAA